MRRVIRTVGAIDYDETALADVTTKFKGWIEKLYVDATGQQVHRGDPLFEIYSPELYSAQVEYLLALDQSGRRCRRRQTLEVQRADQAEVLRHLRTSRSPSSRRRDRPQKTLRINAPARRHRGRERWWSRARWWTPGMKLYRLADLALVWVQAQIYEQDLPFVQLGQEATVTLSYLPDRKFRGRVTYIYPDGGREDAHGARCGWSFTTPAISSSRACSPRWN